jgi:hypothetical protein
MSRSFQLPLSPARSVPECRSSYVFLPPAKSGSYAGLFCAECLQMIAGVVFELLD